MQLGDVFGPPVNLAARLTGARRRVSRLWSDDHRGDRRAGDRGCRAQALWLPDPAADVHVYIALWVATAVICAILIGIEMVARTRRIHSGLADEMIHAATEQFIPAGVAGVLLTVVLYRFAPHSLWRLPGLWQIVFSLGIFASCRSLPRAMFGAGVWYLAAGLASLAFANNARAFSPYAMAVPYGLGQFYIAIVLYRSTGAQDAEA